MTHCHQAVIKRLRLRSFRNYRDLDVVLEPGLNIFCGSNGQGKTNLLEALHFLAFLRSFRTRQIRDLIQVDADQFMVSGRLSGSVADQTLSVQHGQQRQLLQDGISLDKASEFINRFLCVPFLPEDIDLAKGAATSRRRYLDMLIGQMDRGYLVALHTFLQTLKARNTILRSLSRYGSRSLDAFTTPLVEHGTRVVMARISCMARLAPRVAALSREFFADKHQLRLEYRPGFPRDSALARKEFRDETELAAGFQQLLRANAARDEREGLTLYGPQRDDVDIFLDDHPLISFGSEGQCRLTAVLLRLASLALLTESKGTVAAPGPVLLIDDVFGELDAGTRRNFWASVTGVPQIFLTCTERPTELGDWPATLFQVHEGTLQRQAGAVTHDGISVQTSGAEQDIVPETDAT